MLNAALAVPFEMSVLRLPWNDLAQSPGFLSYAALKLPTSGSKQNIGSKAIT